MEPTTWTNIVASTLEVGGHIMIATVVLSVHIRVAKEHKIDKAVVRFMQKERVIAMIGILLIISGYIIEMTM